MPSHRFRYGVRSIEDYYANIYRLLSRMKEVLPRDTIFLWLTTMPLASEIGAGFLLETLKDGIGANLRYNWLNVQSVVKTSG